MTKDIKNYLHLYLGCECVLKADDYRTKVEWADIGYPDTVKHLILRPLSDMTEEEGIKYLRFRHNAYSGEYEIKLRDNGFWWRFKSISSDDKFKFFGEMLDESNSDQFHYLLSKGFDLFDLIPAGLAIDKTTLKQEA